MKPGNHHITTQSHHCLGFRFSAGNAAAYVALPAAAAAGGPIDRGAAKWAADLVPPSRGLLVITEIGKITIRYGFQPANMGILDSKIGL